MPCYTPDPTDTELAQWRKEAAERKDWDRWYSLTPQSTIEQWLCDALRGNSPHDDCLRWWAIHKRKEKR